MPRDRSHTPPQPPDLRATPLTLGGETLMIFSFARSDADLLATGVLTAAEAAVAELAVRGLSNAEIAAHREISIRTVANQMAAVLRKLGCGSRRELAVRHARNELAAPTAQLGMQTHLQVPAAMLANESDQVPPLSAVSQAIPGSA